MTTVCVVISVVVVIVVVVFAIYIGVDENKRNDLKNGNTAKIVVKLNHERLYN